MSLRETLLGAEVPSERVKLPGGEVEVRGLTVGGKDRLERMIDGGLTLRVAAVILTVCDPETHEPLFTEDDADAIASKPAGAFELAVNAALRTSAYTTRELEELEGN